MTSEIPEYVSVPYLLNEVVELRLAIDLAINYINTGRHGEAHAYLIRVLESEPVNAGQGIGEKA